MWATSLVLPHELYAMDVLSFFLKKIQPFRLGFFLTEGVGSNLHDYYTSVVRIYVGIFLCYKYLVPSSYKK